MQVRAVALDAMGVIFPEGDDLRGLLIPFVQIRASHLGEAEVAPCYRACYRDGVPSRSLWEGLGFEYAEGGIEDEFLTTYQLTPGVINFLKTMGGANIPVFGLSNDIAEWAVKRRQMLDLDKHFQGWVISGDLKTIKPDPRMYQALIAMLPCEPGECVFVDDRERNLDAAKEHGLQTVLFGTTASKVHPCISNFGELQSLLVDS